MRKPKRGDVIYLRDGQSFTYVDRLLDAETPEVFEVLDPHGEAFHVRRDQYRDTELRLAVHDDGRRIAWKTVDPT